MQIDGNTGVKEAPYTEEHINDIERANCIIEGL